MSGPYDVFVVAGQSNCYAQSTAGLTVDRTNDVSGGRVFQYGRPKGEVNAQYTENSATVAIGDEPLLHEARNAGNIGFGVKLMRDYYVPNRLQAGRSVLLVPCALGGTGFDNGYWNPGNALYEKMLARCNAAMGLNAGNALVALLWMQGENEAGFSASPSWTQSHYATVFDGMIVDFRSRASGGANCPVVVGGMQPGWVAADSTNRSGVQSAQIAAPGRNTHMAYADPSTPSAIQADTDIHYSQAGQRLFATRWWTALSTLI